MAFADHESQRSSAGVLFTLWAVGSLTGGLWYGARGWRSPASRRFLAVFAALTVGLLPLPLAGSMPGLAALLVLAGLALAPIHRSRLLAGGHLAAAGSLTESYAWQIVGYVVGGSLGAWLAGVLADASGPAAALALAPASCAAGLLVAFAGRRSLGAGVLAAGRRATTFAQRLRLGERGELAQRGVLDLAGALAREPEQLGHLVERLRLLAVEAVAQLDDAAVAVGQVLEHPGRRCRISDSAAASYGLGVDSSGIRSPNWAASPSSPTGLSSDTSCWAARMITSASTGSTPASAAISSTVGSRSPWASSLRCAPSSFLSTLSMWIGIRIVRPLSAIAREIAWRIHQVA